MRLRRTIATDRPARYRSVLDRAAPGGIRRYLSGSCSTSRWTGPISGAAAPGRSARTLNAKGAGSINQSGMASARRVRTAGRAKIDLIKELLATRRSVGVAAYAYSMEQVDNAAKRLQKNKC